MTAVGLRKYKQMRTKTVGGLGPVVGAAPEGARRETIRDEAFAPQLADVASEAPAGDEWAHEIKWDGYRLLCTVVRGKVRLWSRNAIEWTARLPAIVSAILKLRLKNAHLDGELIALFEERADFNLLQATLAGEAEHPLSYAIFDVPHFEGFSLANVPLLERKALLARLLAKPPAGLRYSEHHVGDGAAAFALAEEKGLEGIMSKRVDSGYAPRRTDAWLKVRAVHSDEFAVVGYTEPKGSRAGLGSLLLARVARGGGMSYVGRVGSGMTHAMLLDLTKRLRALARDAAPEALAHLRGVSARRVSWVEPRVVAEVYFRGYGKDGLLRQPSLKGIREDKTMADLKHPSKAQPLAKRASTRAKHVPIAGDPADAARGVKLTSPDRVVFPEAKLTKQQVFDYYTLAAPLLLEDIARRPLSIVRCPDGIASACFFQKHRGAAFGPHVRTVKIREESGKHADYIYVDEVAGVLELVQMNVLEFHPWGATVDDVDRCDRVTFDLDPDSSVPWNEVKSAARLVRDRLQAVGLTSYLRASGGKGLHVVVPLNPAPPWEVAKPFARAFAETLARESPKRFVAVAGKDKRRAKIFVDYLRNSRGQTSVASYSLRARASAAVAMPLAWSELARLSSADAFDLAKARRRIERGHAHPWAGIDDVAQGLEALTRRAA